MANAVAVQIIEQGQRNLIIKLTGLLDTSNESRTIKVDVSALTPAATKVRIDEIFYSISPQLSVVLDWDATTPVPAVYLTGSDHLDFKGFAGLQNNAGSGITGDVFLTTLGWASGSQSYTIILWCVKQ